MIEIVDTADFSCQADFTNGNKVIGNRLVPIGRSDSQYHRQICPRLFQMQAANYIDIGIKGAELHSSPFFRNRQKKYRPVKIKAVRSSAGHIKSRLSDQGLHLRQHRPGAFHDTAYTGAGGTLRTALQQHLGGVWNLFQTAASHLKNADFVGGPESVFGCPQKTIAAVLISFKIQNTVYHVLQNFGAGNGSVFIYVPDHKDCNPLGFTQLHQGHGAVFYLRYTSRGGVVFLVIQGLDGIHNQNIRLHLLNGLQNIRQAGFRQDKQILGRYPQPLSPEL